jgi:cytoskeleton-associated protein 5
LKEKKPTMTEALSQTLQALHKSGCFTLIDVIEDVRVAVKNKVPLVRSLTLTWVAFCIETSNKATVLKLHKEYVPICMEVSNNIILPVIGLLISCCVFALICISLIFSA